MKTVVVISFSPLDRDPRVNRQIRFLNEHYRVIAIGLSDPQIEGVDYIAVKQHPKIFVQKLLAAGKLLTSRYESYYWCFPHVQQTTQFLSEIRADVIIANDILTLPVALQEHNEAKVVFDAHEYFPLQFQDKLLTKLFFRAFNTYLCQKYIPRTDAMITVCDGIGKKYERDTGVKPVIITNAPAYQDLQPDLKLPNDDRIRMIHHGSAQPSRKLENMIKVMDYVDNRFELDLLLVPFKSRYVKKLKRLARHNERIRFLPPVAIQELVTVSHQYDIGLFLLEPTSFSYLHALPNKFFEFIQARLVVAIGPSPEMARIVKKNDLGIVAGDFKPKTLAEKLSGLTHEQINYYKQQSHKAARVMSAEHNKRILLNLVEQVLGNEPNR